MRHVEALINDYVLSYGLKGETLCGPDITLLDHDDNLIRATPWSSEGFTIQKFVEEKNYEKLLEGARKIIFSKLIEFSDVMWPEFRLDQYHKFIGSTERHRALINLTRDGFPLLDFPIPVSVVEDRISEICGVKLTAVPGKFFYLRIIRPGVENDNNPPHRDVWLPEFRNAINIYVPIAGSNAQSSLPLIAGSHLWMESEIERSAGGARIQDLTFQVPAAVGAKKALKMIRPNPRWNEVMVFSPYLIHGGGINLNPNHTRVSLEMRFWRRDA